MIDWLVGWFVRLAEMRGDAYPMALRHYGGKEPKKNIVSVRVAICDTSFTAPYNQDR
jgi:hypothetical protein